MNYKILKVIILSTLIFLVLSLNLFGAQSRIMFSPNGAIASVGETFEMNIALDTGVIDLFAYTVHLKYDSSIIKIVDAYPTSEWLSLSGTDQYFIGADSVEIDPETSESNWYYHVFDVLFTIPKTTIDGFAEIATVKFLAKQTGISTVYYQFYKGSDTLLNSIISSSAEAVVYICPLPMMPGDIDGTGEVDIADLVYFVEYSFNTPPGPPPIPIVLAADMNCDVEVDIADIVYLVEYMFNIPSGPLPCDPCL